MKEIIIFTITYIFAIIFCIIGWVNNNPIIYLLATIVTIVLALLLSKNIRRL